MFGLRNRRRIVLVLGVVCVIGYVHAQGPLTPPGAPGPVMKTLSQVEPRTAITNLPYTINQSGSYYLTGNLSGFFSITIITNDVTLDLMGFTLLGSNSGYGVFSSAMNNLVIRNGTIKGFGEGLKMVAVSGSRFENLIIENSSVAGIFLASDGVNNALDNVIVNCSIRGGADGIVLESSSGYSISGTMIEQNIISQNSGYGIVLRGAGKTDQNRIVGNAIRSNEDDGISLLGAGSIDNLIEGNFFVGNYRGFALQAASTNNVVIRNTAIRNTFGNFTNPGSNTFGPIVTATGALSTTNGAPALSPWANFSR